MAANRPAYQVKADIEKIQLKMSNLAKRTTRDALSVMRSEANNIRDLAIKFAPHDKGLLDDPGSWVIDSARTGINGRYEFTIKLRNGRWFIRNGKRISLGMYAELMHNGWGVHTPYNLRKGSIAKAGANGLSSSPNQSGKYVGWKFLTRAGKVRQLITIQKIIQAIGEIYR